MSSVSGPIITPADYLDLIVLPTLAELLAEPVDQRRAYLACIAAAHLVDHIAVRLPPRPDGRPDLRAVRSAIGRAGPHGRYSAACLAIVEAVSNGTKHALPDPKQNRPIKFMPGYERLVPAFAIGVPEAGIGQGRIGAPGLVVDHDGQHWFLDDCIRAMVRGCVAAFPDLFAGVDLGEVARGADRYGFLDALLPPSDAP